MIFNKALLETVFGQEKYVVCYCIGNDHKFERKIRNQFQKATKVSKIVRTDYLWQDSCCIEFFFTIKWKIFVKVLFKSVNCILSLFLLLVE